MSTPAANDRSPDRGHSAISGLDVATHHDPNGNLIVAISGEIDIKNATQLREFLLPLIATKPPLMVISLELVTFVDSTGLTTLVAIHRRARCLNVELRLTAPPEGPSKVLAITALDSLFTIYPNLDAALQPNR